MRLGVIARADRGGLAAQTWEVVRHLQPERVLLVDLGDAGRGPTDHERFAGVPMQLIHEGPGHMIPEPTIHDFCDGLDVIWSAETFYVERFCDLARAHGARTVLHANPELWKHDFAPPDAVWAATPWELDRLPPGTRVVPHPVATDRLPFRQRTEASRLVHVAAPAFHDRNGTRLVLSACRRVRGSCSLEIRGLARVSRQHGSVTITGRESDVAAYFDAWPDGDILVLPRRYGGLSLPMQEAAALGMAIVSLDLEPQRSWLPPEGLIPVMPRPRQVRMVGGVFAVHDANPAVLAAKIDSLLADPALVEKLSDASGRWAAEHSWEALLPTWRAELERACS